MQSMQAVYKRYTSGLVIDPLFEICKLIQVTQGNTATVSLFALSGLYAEFVADMVCDLACDYVVSEQNTPYRASRSILQMSRSSHEHKQRVPLHVCSNVERAATRHRCA